MENCEENAEMREMWNRRKPVKGISRKHVFFYKLLRPVVILFTKVTFGYRYKKAENLRFLLTITGKAPARKKGLPLREALP